MNYLFIIFSSVFYEIPMIIILVPFNAWLIVDAGEKSVPKKKHSRKNERKKYCGFFNALFSIGICIGQIMFAFEACCCCIQIFDSVFLSLFVSFAEKKNSEKIAVKKCSW